MNKLNTSFKPHFLLSLFLSVWLVVFLIFIAPFDTSDLSLEIRIKLMPAYGLILLVCYSILIPIQKWLYNFFKGWNFFLEMGIILLLFTLTLFANFAYYRTPMVNGTADFVQFAQSIFSPIFFLIVGIIIFARWLLYKLLPPKVSSDKILLLGTNKLDSLQVSTSQIVCALGAQNYVEVHYLLQGKMNKKLLRTTLKEIKQAVPDLIQVHRSNLINKEHFSHWIGSNSISLLGLEIPVSKNYREILKSQLETRP